MQHIIVGLGNTGSEYEHTPHNAGRAFVVRASEVMGDGVWKDKKNIKSLVSVAEEAGVELLLVAPETMMNRSGYALEPMKLAGKKLERLMVVYDDIQLPLGSVKLSFDRSSGGHNGLESVMKRLKTGKFLRMRIGVGPVTPGGKLKHVPDHVEYLLAPLKKRDQDLLDQAFAKGLEIISAWVREGKEAATQLANTKE